MPLLANPTAALRVLDGPRWGSLEVDVYEPTSVDGCSGRGCANGGVSRRSHHHAHDDLEYATIDGGGPGRCSDGDKAKIEKAIDYIWGHLWDIPQTAKPGSFFGHAPMESPFFLVVFTLPLANFRIHCRSNRACRARDGGYPAGYTKRGQWRQRNLDINICEAYLASDPPTGELACVIVHEMMHVWGAKDDAPPDLDRAEDMHPRGWGCLE